MERLSCRPDVKLRGASDLHPGDGNKGRPNDPAVCRRPPKEDRSSFGIADTSIEPDGSWPTGTIGLFSSPSTAPYEAFLAIRFGGRDSSF